MADYTFQYADGSTGSDPYRRGADGQILLNAQGGIADEGRQVGTANSNPTGWLYDGYYSDAAKVPDATPTASFGGGPATGGASNGSTSSGSTSGTATGTGSGGIVNSAMSPTLGAATPWNVTSDQTVAGQVQNLIKSNNPLIQQATTAAKEQSQERGLLNSSLAVTAGQQAAYNAALPIATADAATNAKAAGYNADQSNVNNQLQYTQGNSLAAANLSAETSKYVANLNSQTSQTVAKLNNDAQAALAQEQQKNQAILQTSSAAASAYNTYANALLNIQLSTTMNAGAKATAIANAQNAYNFAMTAAYKLSSAQLPDFSKQLDFSTTAPVVPPGTDPMDVEDPSIQLPWNT